MDTVFSLMDGNPSLARDAKPVVDFYVQLEKERVKVGVGMVSQRYQRLERRLLGKQVGPDTLDRGALGAPAGSVGLGVSAPDFSLADKTRKNPPPKDERKMLAEYARFLPAANRDETTPLKELQKEGALAVSRRTHALAHAMGTPQRVCLQLTPEVRKKLGELGVTSGGMLRAAPNPIRDAAKVAKAQESSGLLRPSRMPRSQSPRGQAVAAPRALPPQSPRRFDTGAMQKAPPRSTTSIDGSQSARVDPLPRSVGKTAARISPHSARASPSARGGSPVQPSAATRKGAGNGMDFDVHEQMQKFVERREAAMRRNADLFIEQQRRVADGASWALDQESRSGEEKVHAHTEAAERAARRRLNEARRRHDKLSKEVDEEARANQIKAVELMQARSREMHARVASEKQLRESIVEARQKEAKERAIERARRVQQRQEALLRYQELNAANAEAAAERRENLRPAPRSEAMETRRQDAERLRVARWDDRDFETHQALNQWKAKAAKADEYQRQVLNEQKIDHIKRRAREGEVVMTRAKLIEERLTSITRAQEEAAMRSATVLEMHEREHAVWVKEQRKKEEEKRQRIQAIEEEAGQRDAEQQLKWEEHMTVYAERIEGKQEETNAMQLLRAEMDMREAQLKERMRQAMVDSADVDREALYQIISRPVSSFMAASVFLAFA